MKSKIMLITAILILIIFGTKLYSGECIIDSKMTFEESIKGTKAPAKIIKTLAIINVKYYAFDGKLHQGQLVLRKDRVEEIKKAFEIMRNEKFPVAKCIPIVKYGWSDDSSMADNNTSMFNYRRIAGKKTLSNHAYGVAIDINPVQNPAVYSSGKASPKGAKYVKKAKGTLLRTSPVTVFLLENGWRWGGDWRSLKDWQHFDKK